MQNNTSLCGIMPDNWCNLVPPVVSLSRLASRAGRQGCAHHQAGQEEEETHSEA